MPSSTGGVRDKKLCGVQNRKPILQATVLGAGRAMILSSSLFYYRASDEVAGPMMRPRRCDVLARLSMHCPLPELISVHCHENPPSMAVHEVQQSHPMKVFPTIGFNHLLPSSQRASPHTRAGLIPFLLNLQISSTLRLDVSNVLAFHWRGGSHM